MGDTEMRKQMLPIKFVTTIKKKKKNLGLWLISQVGPERVTEYKRFSDLPFVHPISEYIGELRKTGTRNVKKGRP